MPGKQARVLCPVCQEPIPPDETECENCGAFVIDEAVVRLGRAFGLKREAALKLVEAGFRHPRQLRDRDPDSVLQRGEVGLLFICTNCGSFVAGGDSRCARCNAEFEAEPEEAPAREEDILDLVLCPVCGADNDPEFGECEICGEPLRAPSAPVARSGPAASFWAPGPASAQKPSERGPSAAGVAPQGPSASPPPEESKAPKGRAPIARDAAARAPARPPLLEKIPEVKPVATPEHAPRVTALATPSPAPPRAPAPQPLAPQATAPKPLASAALPVKRIRLEGRENRSEPRADKAGVRRDEPTPETVGGLVVASAASLLLAGLLGQAIVSGGIAVFLAGLCAYAFLRAVRAVDAWPGRLDAALLAAGSGLGLVALAIRGTPGGADVAPMLAVGAAIPFAVATRRLLPSKGRIYLAIASAVPLIGLAAANAREPGVIVDLPWVLGVLAAIPWPGALAATEVRRRQAAAILRRDLVRAEREVAQGNYAKSLEEFDRAIAVARRDAPGAEVPWYGKGATLVLMGRYEDALRAIDTALDINPHNEVAWVSKGNALAKMGRHVDALRCFNAAIRVNPDYEVAWNNKGNAFARLGKFEDALQCYERALTIDPNYRGAWVNKGYVLTKMGRFEEAASCADRALRLEPRRRAEAA